MDIAGELKGQSFRPRGLLQSILVSGSRAVWTQGPWGKRRSSCGIKLPQPYMATSSQSSRTRRIESQRHAKNGGYEPFAKRPRYEDGHRSNGSRKHKYNTQPLRKDHTRKPSYCSECVSRWHRSNEY